MDPIDFGKAKTGHRMQPNSFKYQYQECVADGALPVRLTRCNLGRLVNEANTLLNI